MCIYVCMFQWAEELLACCVWPYFSSCIYVVRGLCVSLQEAEMGAASKEAAVRFSPAVNCACACVHRHAHARVSLCATVCMFVLTSVC